MASFVEAAIRLLLSRKPAEGRMDDTRAQGLGGRPHGEPPAHAAAADADADADADVAVIPPDRHRPVYLNPEEDPLTFFRLMLGIQTTPYLGFTLVSAQGTRPAANIGLYARVVHSEQKAKDSFKVFSIVINGCYFLQIVIAAALTALGAARASSGAVTAFGALNTVIAGFLTFLKGSGLPGRLKYYGNEWKKIREFIEQRERDFMRSGGRDLDVHDVVETIEKMYNNLKADIELNTPDSYTSVTNQRRVGEEKETRVGGIDTSKLETLAAGLKGAENGKLGDLASGGMNGMRQREKQVKDEVERVEEDVARGVQSHEARLDREAKERDARARAAINEGKQVARDGVKDTRADFERAIDEHRRQLSDAVGEQRARTSDTIGDAGRAAAEQGVDRTSGHTMRPLSNLLEELSEIHQTAASGGRTAAARQIQRLALRLAGRDERHDEQRREVGEAEKP
ncbi:hypothetical protein F5X97DRAFT_251315 [Nemania serpens]|nr:hypothetical protein F5X97DRAFT_251315 [Nemania serpens]